MRILFMHNNFPGQYRRIYQYLQSFPEYEMAVATLASNKQKTELKTVFYKPHREATKEVHYSLASSEKAVLMGQAAYKALLSTKEKGYRPDIILAHSGWGASLFMRDLFPDAKILNYYEWYYHCHGGDGEFFRDSPYDPNDEIRIRVKNTPILHDLVAQDWGQSPTQFQHSRLPALFQPHVSVLHDGVDTAFFSPLEGAALEAAFFELPDGRRLTAADEVISYIARGMEDYRGFRQFMEMVSRLQKTRPNLQTVIIGEDRIAYGSQFPDGKGLKKWALETFDYDKARLHFTGSQPLQALRDLLQITRAHIYLTAPFVLSWSMMEAMGAGALIIGSDTAPVQEIITDGDNGLLVPFFDVDALTDKVDYALEHPSEMQALKAKARQLIAQDYSTEKLLPRYRALIDAVANGLMPKLGEHIL